MRVALKLGDRELLGRFDQIKQVVGHLLAVTPRGLGGRQVHAAIDAHGVHADDVDVDVALSERYFMGERRLTGCGGPHQSNRRASRGPHEESSGTRIL